MIDKKTIKLNSIKKYFSNFTPQNIQDIVQEGNNFLVNTNVNTFVLNANFKDNKRYLTDKEYKIYKNNKIRIQKDNIGYYIKKDELIQSSVSIKNFTVIDELYRNNIFHDDSKSNDKYYKILSNYKYALERYEYRFNGIKSRDLTQIRNGQLNIEYEDNFDKWYVVMIDWYKRKLSLPSNEKSKEILYNLIEKNRILPDIMIYNDDKKRYCTQQDLISLIHSTCDKLQKWKKELNSREKLSQEYIINFKKNYQ